MFSSVRFDRKSQVANRKSQVASLNSTNSLNAQTANCKRRPTLVVCVRRANSALSARRNATQPNAMPANNINDASRARAAAAAAGGAISRPSGALEAAHLRAPLVRRCCRRRRRLRRSGAPLETSRRRRAVVVVVVAGDSTTTSTTTTRNSAAAERRDASRKLRPQFV